MKIWLIIGLMAIAVSYPAEKQQNGGQEHQTKTKREAQNLSPASTEAKPHNPHADVKQCCCNDDTETIWKKATSPETWPNWALVIAGLGAIIVGLRTLGAIKRQADLQQSAMRQWITTSDWKARFGEEKRSLEIGFKMSNSSKFPLTIKNGEISLRHGKGIASVQFATDLRLLPDLPAYPQIIIEISEDEAARFLTEGLAFSVEGEIIHDDMGSNKPVAMPICGSLAGKHGNPDWKAYFTPTPIVSRKKDESQDPN